MLAAAAIPVTLGIVWIFANFMTLSTYIQNMVMLIGLGIAIDYSLLMVNRYREEPVRGGREDGGRAHDGDGGPRRRVQRHGGRDRPLADAVHAPAVHARLRGGGLSRSSRCSRLTLLPVLLYWLEDRSTAFG